eukprot:TRINITY_DN7053_c0_g2_i1.p1 TRINITY_DN7053_c0_g2~~TRINITY_DN7053_c0_g2_i1.p1  ORF type:complete len:401 (-),score=95.36 TRINITY_DN7053_c0_g2_i1:208-1386(-)
MGNWILTFDHSLIYLNRKNNKYFTRDKNIECLLVFPPKSDFHDHKMVLNGSLILQDKASCIPPVVLMNKGFYCQLPQTEQDYVDFLVNNESDDNLHVIDCCAAPGSKTSQLSALMNNSGTLYAYELSKPRYNTLVKLCTRSNVKNMTAFNGNFLDVDVDDDKYATVEYIQVDPSCSGSGIQSRIDDLLLSVIYKKNNNENKNRLIALAKFQYRIVSKALSFPNVKRVVYSTCSIHEEENEQVVRDLLNDNPKFKLSPIFKDTWNNRGTSLFDTAPYCIRANPEQNKTNGFFVSCFELKTEDEINNQTYNNPSNSNLDQKIEKVENNNQNVNSNFTQTSVLGKKRKLNHNNKDNDDNIVVINKKQKLNPKNKSKKNKKKTKKNLKGSYGKKKR